MFWWTDRYRPVTTPNYDQFGTPGYYGLAAVQKLAVFCVPAFLFTSGFFIAYAARSSRSTLNWKMVKVRIRNLLVPYLIWSGVIFLGDFLQGITYAPVEYLRQLAFGEVVAPYFYIPLLCQLYLLSPLLVPMAKTRGRQLLFVSMLVLLSVLSLRYLGIYGEFAGVEMPVVDRLTALLPPCSFLRLIFFFVFGILASFHLRQFKQWLARLKWILLPATVVLGLLAIFETDVIYRSTGVDYRGSSLTVFASLYALSFILCFLAFDKVRIPFAKHLYQLGSRSYGIYLLHPTVLKFVARFLQKFAPWILAYQMLYLPVLIILAAGGPLVFMKCVAKSPVRRSYRYLFG